MKMSRFSQVAVVTGLFVVGVAVVAHPSPKGGTYAEDRAAIENLQARYMFAMDWGDADTYAATFTEDGVLDSAGGIAKGRKAIHDEIVNMNKHLARRAAEQSPGVRPARMRHNITNIVLDIEGDHAKGVAYWVGFSDNNPERKAEIAAYGHYEDRLVKRQGRWYFASRKIYNEQIAKRAAGSESPGW